MAVIHNLLVLFMLLLGATAALTKQKWDSVPNRVRNSAYPPDIVDKLQAKTMPKVEAWMAKRAGNTNNCTLENAAVRREWSDLSVPEREEYIRAVLCLQSKPARTPKDIAPGAISRYDDFVATHFFSVSDLHIPGSNLLTAHRYYVWAYETALRDECGYTGYQPYMNWDRYAHDLLNSPLLNGNMSSMGGDGEPSPYPGIKMPYPPPFDLIPPGNGGGCVTKGPFKDMVVNLGPVKLLLNIQGARPNPRKDGMGYNPRCLRRDLNIHSALGGTANYTYLTLMEVDINGFYNRYMGWPALANDSHPWGIHTAGHFMWGGDPGADFFTSPGDPLFFLHHAMLDRVWWIWQMQDPETRLNAIATVDMTPMNDTIAQFGPKSKGGKVSQNPDEIVIDLGWTAPPAKLLDMTEALGGLGGKFCHIYA